MSEHVITINDSSFEEQVLNAEHPVLVDFWAPWCNPCKMIAPILEEVAGDYVGKVAIAKLNIDGDDGERSEIPVKYGVRGIPTLLLFHKGEVIGTHVGALTKSQLAEFIDSNTSN